MTSHYQLQITATGKPIVREYLELKRTIINEQPHALLAPISPRSKAPCLTDIIAVPCKGLSDESLLIIDDAFHSSAEKAIDACRYRFSSKIKEAEKRLAHARDLMKTIQPLLSELKECP